MKNAITEIAGEKLNSIQLNYLDGFFTGIGARGMTFADAVPVAAKTEPPAIFEERVKKEEHPLDSYYRITQRAGANSAPDREDTFRFKWNGLFFLDPVHQAFMCRLRIPGGDVTSYQLRELAKIADDLTTGYLQITTRANFQLRLIKPKDAPEVLRRIQAIGLSSKGTGADNIRNLTCTPTSGLDPHELIDVLPYCHEIGQFIREHREFYDLPRKFNIAYDGGGAISVAEDSNDLGARAVRITENDQGIAPGIYFRIAAGGATGHQAFAGDLGVIVSPERVNETLIALLRVYIAKGNRENRKKARLKHLLEKMPLSEYLAEAEKLLGYQLVRLAEGSAIEAPRHITPEPHPQVGTFPQKQTGLNYIGAGIPVGQVTSRQLRQIADIADQYGSGEVRLTIWQNLLIPNIPDAGVANAQKAIRRAGFTVTPSHIATGVIACTGNRYCKFAQADTKGHALALIKALEKKVLLDTPINIHLTGCPHSCAQHYMGDIGLLGTKNAHKEESYHVFIGGGFGTNQALGRQIFNAISAGELPDLVEKMLKGYLRHREDGETFSAFTRRHEIGRLQEIFTNNE